MEDILWTDEGYYYPERKKTGKRIVAGFTGESLILSKGSLGRVFGQAIFRKFGIVGALFGAASEEKQIRGFEKNIFLTVPYTSICAMRPDKSMMNGAGIAFELEDGSAFKLSTLKMSMGGLKKLFPEFVEMVIRQNPSVRVEEKR